MLFIAVMIVHVTSCILLVIAVLLQSGKDAGLSGAFGLGGGGQAIFGARAGDVLMKVTVVLAMLFMTSCLIFTRIRPAGSSSIVATAAEEKAPQGLPPAGEGVAAEAAKGAGEQ